MTKEQIKNIMKNRLVFESEIENAFNVVEDLLYFRAKEIEKEVPYAVNTIRRLREAEYEVWELWNEIEEILEV